MVATEQRLDCTSSHSPEAAESSGWKAKRCSSGATSPTMRRATSSPFINSRELRPRDLPGSPWYNFSVESCPSSDAPLPKTSRPRTAADRSWALQRSSTSSSLRDAGPTSPRFYSTMGSQPERTIQVAPPSMRRRLHELERSFAPAPRARSSSSMIVVRPVNKPWDYSPRSSSRGWSMIQN